VLDSGAPHSPQNLSPGLLALPHDGHVTARALPHSLQNFCPAGFSAPQLAHAAIPEA
jgi:hypothetical protein